MQKHAVKVIAFCLFAFMSFSAWAQDNGIPVVRINTQNGAGINSNEIYTPMSLFSLVDPNDSKNNLARLDINDGIKGRGNSTWFGTPQKSYRIKFDKKTSLFGLPAAKSWVLLTSYFDPTLLKTAFAFELGDRLNMPFNHSYHLVDLYLNGKYNGSYILTEHKQVGEGRVDISETEGWFVELDFHYDEDPKFNVNKFGGGLVHNWGIPVMILSPKFEPANMNNPAYKFVKDDWDQLCNLMDARDFPNNGYRDLIDLESVAKYFLVEILMQNNDFNHPGSVHFHKDKGGLITAGSLWDFDICFGMNWRDNNPPIRDWYYRFNTGVGNDWRMNPDVRDRPTFPFFKRFFDDPVFVTTIRKVWTENHSKISSMSQFIDHMADKVRKSAAESHNTWRKNENVDFDYWIGEMKNYLDARISFLNQYYGAPATPGRNNVALGKPATASSEYNHSSGHLIASNATDGNSETRWGSNEDGQRYTKEWIQIDLLKTYNNIDEITIEWKAACAKVYDIQISTDEQYWTTHYSTTSGSGGYEQIKKDAAARYIRINCNEKASVGGAYYGYSIINVQVFATTSKSIDQQFISDIEIRQSASEIYIISEGVRSIELYTINGQLVRSQASDIIQTAGLTKGIYILKVAGINGKQKTFKVVI